MGEEETFNQAINGHSLRATQRMPNVTDLRAASVHEPSGNNGDCAWRRETVSLVNRLLRHHPVGTEDHMDITDVLTTVHLLDRVQPPMPEAPNEEAATPAGPSTTEGPSTSTAPAGCPSRLPIATPWVVPTPDPSPSTPHPSSSPTIPSSTPHPSPSPTIPSPIPHSSPRPTIPPPTPHPCPGSDIRPPIPRSFLKVSPIPSFDLGIHPTPLDMQQEPPSHNTSIGPSSAIDPPHVQVEQAVGLPTQLEGRPKRIS
ncbi:vegetative cell wall protein gp1-like [Quercus robur]|uniref:vegetative cell wall protein gp1-like n=1 Tax=Quercus robur TaxID=38942 RepID=UPI002162C422|nr:vegetative cell wall protein gp1-like [Quercus robur]